MPAVTERARAKINLTLTVLGRRPGGYHDLLSLVAFADEGDTVTLDPAGATGLTVTGPFAAAIDGPNLIETALRLVDANAPGLAVGHVTLAKELPVASGVGGGSSDAAALLRAIARAHGQAAEHLDLKAIARRLGADVPVCVADRAVWMSGAGENLHGLAAPLPKLDAVLVNPCAPVPADKTSQVFRAAGAAPLPPGFAGVSALPAIPDRAELLALMRRTGNDLETPAMAVVPEIDQVLTALSAAPGAISAHLSGAGPTCFAVFEDEAAAKTAARALAESHPDWWIRATVIS